MLTVENDWIEYEPTTARRVAVRGGAACAQRVPLARAVDARHPSARPLQAVPVRALHAVERPAPRRTVTGPLRLTRRGRFVLVVLPALLALSGALVALTAPGSAEAASGDRAAARTVVIGSGDTLWSLAGRIAPDRDPREVVALVERANRLRTAQVPAGAVLVLPAGLGG